MTELVTNPDDSIPSKALLPIVPRFRTIASFQLEEDSNIHLDNGETVSGKRGDWLIMVDYFQYVVLPHDTFKILFKNAPPQI